MEEGWEESEGRRGVFMCIRDMAEVCGRWVWGREKGSEKGREKGKGGQSIGEVTTLPSSYPAF